MRLVQRVQVSRPARAVLGLASGGATASVGIGLLAGIGAGLLAGGVLVVAYFLAFYDDGKN